MWNSACFSLLNLVSQPACRIIQKNLEFICFNLEPFPLEHQEQLSPLFHNDQCSEDSRAGGRLSPEAGVSLPLVETPAETPPAAVPRQSWHRQSDRSAGHPPHQRALVSGAEDRGDLGQFQGLDCQTAMFYSLSYMRKESFFFLIYRLNTHLVELMTTRVE